MIHDPWATPPKDEREAGWREGYVVGDRDGAADFGADWSFALDEYGEFPDDVDIDYESPMEVARYIAGLHRQLREHAARRRGRNRR